MDDRADQLYNTIETVQCFIEMSNYIMLRNEIPYTGWSKKGNPLLAAISKIVLEVINLSVYIFGKFRLFYVSGEEIVVTDARMSLIRLFEHI